ncbi:interleukin-12 subunit alpha [Astyanax mexicanus]|uniref:interleukin-12 subunit alpha n=1 Tax=Astyanax mexicanus TaxID=7994 RepID=UPI0020CAB3AF|nr:interleukin-12 subunit alpha [Astyanax mexicanus]
MALALLCAGALGTPLRTNARPETDAQSCTTHAKALLVRLKSVLEAALDQKRSVMFNGFNCTELSVIVVPHSQTPSICQPSQHVTCSSQSSQSFNKNECLKNITGDLQYYRSMLNTYVKSLDQTKSQTITDLTSITDSIQTLQKNCQPLQNTEEQQTENWKPKGQAFEDRMDLCKQLKGFHIRAITINRALGYISAEADNS